MSEQRTRKQILDDIKANPEKHKHDFDGLLACCFVDGALDVTLIDAHERRTASGRHDVVQGPCSCGGWH